MNRNLISIVLILSLMGCAVALDFQNGVEMRPGEAAAEHLFEKGIGQPWVGGNPPFSNSFDHKFFDHPSSAWGWRYDPFTYYSYQGKTYNPHRYFYPYTYYGGYSWY
jgi:hypothetical protein